jgi:hypothetical protein
MKGLMTYEGEFWNCQYIAVSHFHVLWSKKGKTVASRELSIFQYICNVCKQDNLLEMVNPFLN